MSIDCCLFVLSHYSGGLMSECYYIDVCLFYLEDRMYIGCNCAHEYLYDCDVMARDPELLSMRNHACDRHYLEMSSKRDQGLFTNFNDSQPLIFSFTIYFTAAAGRTRQATSAQRRILDEATRKRR